MSKQRALRWLAAALPILVVSMVIVLIIVWTSSSHAQSSAHSLPASQSPSAPLTSSSNVTGTTSTGIITVVVQLPPDTVTNDTYKEVATTAIGASKDVLDIVKWLIGAIVAFVGAAASLLIAFFTYTSNKVKEASEAATKSSTSASSAAQLAENSADRVEKLLEQVKELSYSVGESLSQVGQAHLELERFRQSAKRDMALQKRNLALLRLDEYGMGIRSEDPTRRWKAISAALEMSTREDDIIRRKAVRILGTTEECNERILQRLKEMAVSDPARGVRQEAEKRLKVLQQLCDEKADEQFENPAEDGE